MNSQHQQIHAPYRWWSRVNGYLPLELCKSEVIDAQIANLEDYGDYHGIKATFRSSNEWTARASAPNSLTCHSVVWDPFATTTYTRSAWKIYIVPRFRSRWWTILRSWDEERLPSPSGHWSGAIQGFRQVDFTSDIFETCKSRSEERRSRGAWETISTSTCKRWGRRHPPTSTPSRRFSLRKGL